MRTSKKTFFLLAFILSLGIIAFSSYRVFGTGWKPKTTVTDNQKINISIRKFESIERLPLIKYNNQGHTVFKTGFYIESKEKTFGGWSGLAISDDKKQLFSISDSGIWFNAHLTWENGTVTDINNSQIGFLRDQGGNNFRSIGRGDIEAIAIKNNIAILASESPRSILHIANNWNNKFESIFSEIKGLNAFTSLPKGRGIESLTWIEQDAKPVLMAIAERDPSGTANVPLWLIRFNDHNAPIITNGNVFIPNGYDISDASYSRNCGLLLLLRKVNWYMSFGTAILHIDQNNINKNTSKFNGEMIFEANSLLSRYGNMEGLAVFDEGKNGCGALMIEDDNFLPIQSTKLIQLSIF